MRSFKWLGFLLSVLLLLQCACGGGASNNSASPQAPSALSYTTSTAVYTVGTAIPANSPTSSGGAVSSYSVSPALPAGLALSATTGVLTGTPTAVTAAASYAVTASNSAGSTQATLTITVQVAAPAGLAYSTAHSTYTVGTPISPNSPTSTGGAVTAYGVSPALPAGLSLDGDTGTITGTPTATSAQANYTVMASNLTGNSTATLTITVNAAGAGVQFIPNLNQWITPLAPQGSQFAYLDTGLTANGQPWLAGQGVSSAVSPDGATLLVLTSGFNRMFNADDALNPDGTPYDFQNSREYVFIYDVTADVPVMKQVVQIPNAYSGIAFDPVQHSVGGQLRYDTFYVSSGMGDYPYSGGAPYTTLAFPPAVAGRDNVHSFTLAPDGTWTEQLAELALGHTAGNGLGVPPCAAGVAVSPDGQTLVAVNYYNDSITVFTGGVGHWAALGSLNAAGHQPGELDLRPGKAASSPLPGTPGGEYPFWTVIAQPTPLPAGSSITTWAYISSIRDREIDVVNLDGGTPAVTARIRVKGQPNKMILNAAQTRLYVAEDQTDTIDVVNIDPNAAPSVINTVVETIPITQAIVPAALALYKGANTNSVAISPNGTELLVTNGNLNAVAVVALTGTDKNDQVVGLIPTGWYPTAVSFNPDGKFVYVVNGKSPTGPNPNYCYSGGPATYPNCFPSNEYNPQRTKAGLQSFPTATLAAQLPALTAQVVTNNRLSAQESATDAAVMAAVRKGIQHVIFVMKENRTYDEILGDLSPGNGDPTLCQFGQTITPNLHNLAHSFVTLDNLMAASEVSYDGWSWTTGARATDVVEHQYTINYANRGLSLDFNGFNRNVNVALPTLAQRRAANPVSPNDPDVLPGQADVAAPDGPDNEVNTGHLWDAALRAGLAVRNYGFFVDATCYNVPQCAIPLVPYPAQTNTVVAYPSNAALTPYTDPYYRGFDLNFPDYYRYTEWAREFDANYANPAPGSAPFPALSLVELGHDHTGNFGTAIDLVNTPELMESDNDYAVGLLVQKIANSIYANNTLIFIIEDDAQDGADHVDSHRTTAYVAGAYVKQGAVVSTRYNSVDFIRTMEEVLGIPPMNLNDALATPMADIFNTTPRPWSFTAAPSSYLYASQLPLPPKAAGLIVPKSTHDAKYWARVTKGMDFSDADRIDDDVYNRILWKGLMGNRPYPAASHPRPAPRRGGDRDDESPQRKTAKESKVDND